MEWGAPPVTTGPMWASFINSEDSKAIPERGGWVALEPSSRRQEKWSCLLAFLMPRQQHSKQPQGKFDREPAKQRKNSTEMPCPVGRLPADMNENCTLLRSWRLVINFQCPLGFLMSASAVLLALEAELRLYSQAQVMRQKKQENYFWILTKCLFLQIFQATTRTITWASLPSPWRNS